MHKATVYRRWGSTDRLVAGAPQALAEQEMRDREAVDIAADIDLDVL